MGNDLKKKYLVLGGAAVILLVISMLIYTFVSADDITNKIKVKTAKITSIVTGSESFDESDGLIDNTSIVNYIAGNDSSGDNRIVRSFDTLTYNFNFMLTGKDGDLDFSDRTVDINVELTSDEAMYVVFESDGMPGQASYTYHFDGIHNASTFDKSITLYVLGAPNGTTINPKFIIKESTDEDTGVLLGKVSSEENYYNYENDNYSNQATFTNYMPTIVSSKSAVIKAETLTSNNSQKTYYDGKNGSYVTFVSDLYIEGDANKGIKGLDMPIGDITFDSTIASSGHGDLIIKPEWARLFDSNYVEEIEPVVVSLPYSSSDINKDQKHTKLPGMVRTEVSGNTYTSTISDYYVTYDFPTTASDDTPINGKYYIGTYAYTVFVPRTSEDGKNSISVSYTSNGYSVKGTNNEDYQIDGTTRDAIDEYNQTNNSSYESAFYTEDDKKINSDSTVGSLSKGSNVYYKTSINYKKGSEEQGLKEVIKINPYAFRLFDYSDEDSVYIKLMCGDNECPSISKNDFEIKFISGTYNPNNYQVTDVNPRISEAEMSSFESMCSSINLSELNADQMLNIYGSPCIIANSGVESSYELIEDFVDSENNEIPITKVVIQTKNGVSIPDNAKIEIKAKLRVRNVPDITRAYQVASVISTSDYDNVLEYYNPVETNVVNPNNYILPTLIGNETVINSNVSYADAVRIANYTSDQEITVLNKDSNNEMKINYNTSDNETITYNIKPIIKDESEKVGSDDTWIIKNIRVYVVLPAELEYIPDSAIDKYLIGTDTLNNKTYLLYSLPFTKPNMDNGSIQFKAKLNSRLSGTDIPVTISSYISALNVNNEIDNSLFGENLKDFTIYATGEENVIVEQKIGEQGSLIEKNTEFSYLLSAYNNSTNAVNNYEIIDILPANGDDNESIISGSYETKLVVPASLGTVSIYCSTQNYSDMAKEINSSKNEWVECNDLNGTYKTITAFRIANISIQPGVETEPIRLIIKPTNNNYSDRYTNNFIGGNAELDKNTSNKISVNVVSRSISGKVFYDNNENGIQDESDKYVSDIPVSLYKITETDDVKVGETTTDKDGKYIFNDLDVGNYYIDLSYNGNKYDLTRRYASLDEKIDSDAYKVSDSIARISNKRIPDDPFGIALTNDIITLENYDMGLVQKYSFGFEIKKYITRIDLNYNGTINTLNYNNESKVLLSVKNSLNATAKVYYGIAVTNNSSRPGYVTELEENIPSGLLFNPNDPDNLDWTLINGRAYSTALSSIVINPGETKYLRIVLNMPSRETAATFLNTVSIINMSEYVENTETPDSTYVNPNNYAIGEKVDYAGMSWHVIDTENMDDGSQKVTLFADSGSISQNMAHTYSVGDIYKWGASTINYYLNNNLMSSSLDYSVLYNTSVCNDASGLEVATYGGNIFGSCQSYDFVNSKVRLLSKEEYTRLINSSLSNIDWLTGGQDYWLESSDTSSSNKALYIGTTGIKSDNASTNKEVRPVITISSRNILFE